MKFLESVGCKTWVEVDPRFRRVMITVQQAMNIKIFNPEISTHRRKLLERLASVQTFQRHWPEWLQLKGHSVTR